MWPFSSGVTEKPNALGLTKAETNLQGKNCKTLLHYAAEQGLKAVVLELLANGADFTLYDDTGYLPFHLAVLKGHKEVAVILYGKLRLAGVALDPKCKKLTLYHLAAQSGLEGLLDAGSLQMHMPCGGGWQPIHYAMRHGQLQFVRRYQTLWRGRCLPTTIGRETPLHIASRYGHLACVEWLLIGEQNFAGIERLMDKETILEAQDDEGRTPLWVACSSGQFTSDHLAIAQRLVKAGANVQVKKKKHNLWSALAWAEMMAHMAQPEYLVDFLCEHQVPLLADTPVLEYAVKSKRVALVQRVLALPVDVNQTFVDEYGIALSILHIAVQFGGSAVLECLLQHPGIHVNAKTKEGETPLDCAVARNQEAMIDALCRKNAVAQDHRTLLAWSLKNNRPDIFTYATQGTPLPLVEAELALSVPVAPVLMQMSVSVQPVDNNSQRAVVASQPKV